MAKEQPVGCLGFLFRLLGIGGDGGSSEAPAGKAPLPYKRKDYLLTKAEASFFGVLNQAVGQDYWLFAKIRIADLVYMPRGTESRQGHFNKVKAKHVDFLLCTHNGVQPVLAIELDDSTHARPSRQSRDEFVNDALGAAGLPLLRVPAKHSYHVEDLREQVRQAMRTSA